MKLLRRIAAALVCLVSLVGLILSLAGGIGVWIIKEPVQQKVLYLFGRVETKLDIAEQGLDHAQESLTRAAERLESVNEERRKAAQQPQPGGIGRFLARTVQQRLAPELGNAQETLHTVAEAAVVVNSVLEDVGSFPMLATSGLDLTRLTEMNSRLADVGPAAWELSRLLGETSADSDAQASRIERTLQTLPKLIADYQAQVAQVRERVDAIKAKVLFWMLPGAILISFVFFWIAFSQVSVLFHARSWWRGA
jgi:flagellar biosynthesis chaperone FliJ